MVTSSTQAAEDATPLRRGSCWPRVFLLISALAGGCVGAALVVSDDLRARALEALALVGGSYRVQYESRLPAGESLRTSEYLVVLRGATSEAAYLQYLQQQPGIEYLSTSVYPNTIRVAIEVPVTTALSALEAQPFARFVVRNLPIFFCH